MMKNTLTVTLKKFKFKGNLEILLCKTIKISETAVHSQVQLKVFFFK
jgi:hypothetical protein